MNLEEQLRQALRRTPPPHDLAPAVAARLRRPPRPARRRWLPAAAAALVLAAGLGLMQWRQQQARTQAGRDARQLAAALRLASHKLQQVRAHLDGGAY